jgi:hypothetical protein
MDKIDCINLFDRIGNINMKRMSICAATLASLALVACGGGGSTPIVLATPAPSMLSVKPPANSGTVTGFNYATQNSVAVDIALSYPNGLVTIYAARPTGNIYDASGVLLSTLVQPAPAVLTEGLSAAAAGSDGKYHFIASIAMPADATTVFLASPARIDVPVLNNAVTFPFSGAIN